MLRFIKQFGIVGVVMLQMIGFPVTLVLCIFCETIYWGTYPALTKVANIHWIFIAVSASVALLLECFSAVCIVKEEGGQAEGK